MKEFLQFPLGPITVEQLATAILIVVVGILIVKLFLRALRKVVERLDWDESLRGVVMVIVRFLAYTFVILTALDYLGIPMTSVMTVLSVVGLAVSLAIQDTLANIFAGMLLLSTKVFSSGDYVQLDGHEGTVIKVDLMNTHLRMADNKTVRIPNHDVQTSPIVNFSRSTLRRVEIRVTVSYDDDTETVKAALIRAAEEAPIVEEPTPFAGLFAYQPSGIEFVVRAWAENDRYWDAYFAMTEGIRRTFEEYGVSMTYDHINVHMIEPKKEDAR